MKSKDLLNSNKAKTNRATLLQAMDYVIRAVDNEELVLPSWLMCGVADGDGSNLEILKENYDVESFKEITQLFLKLMNRMYIAKESFSKI
ncbi:MAG: hypothetical protein ACI31I_04900 [Bacilli bacterium]